MLIHHQTKIALGSETTLLLVADSARRADRLFIELWLDIFRFEQRFSRFLPDSELSVFNRGAGLKQPISPEFRDILIKAKAIGRLTGGLYNPFVLPALQRAGYKRSFVKAHAADMADNFEDRGQADIDKLEVGDGWARIPYGTAIDLGGCGKGYLADQLAAKVEAADFLQGYWFSLGGDIVAGGCDENDEPWDVGIEAVGLTAGEKLIGHTKGDHERPMAVATSAVTARRGIHKGKAWHHIIDPRTGKPAKTDLLAVSIRDGSAFRADVLATCLIIEGSAAAEPYMNNYNLDGLMLHFKNKRPIYYGAIGRPRTAHKEKHEIA